MTWVNYHYLVICVLFPTKTKKSAFSGDTWIIRTFVHEKNILTRDVFNKCHKKIITKKLIKKKWISSSTKPFLKKKPKKKPIFAPILTTTTTQHLKQNKLRTPGCTIYINILKYLFVSSFVWNRYQGSFDLTIFFWKNWNNGKIPGKF